MAQCIDCGAESTGQRCRKCRKYDQRIRKNVYDQSEVVLTNGYWENVNGIQRWRSLI